MAVGGSLVGPHHTDGPEADTRVAADRVLVVGRWVDREAMVAASGEIGDGEPECFGAVARPCRQVVSAMSNATLG